MSAEVFPVFNPKVSEAIFKADGKLLLEEHQALDNLATELGLTPFSAFGDNRDVPDDFDGDLEELDEVLGEWDEWFPIDDALETLDGLVNAMNSQHETLKQFEEPELIKSNLIDLAGCLRIAKKKNAVFRLEIA